MEETEEFTPEAKVLFARHGRLWPQILQGLEKHSEGRAQVDSCFEEFWADYAVFDGEATSLVEREDTDNTS